MDADSFDPATLLEHRAFLRRLARGLTADRDGAEDLVQETWLAALRRPPREGVPARAWLARVARNLAANARRGEVRRRARERESARPERLEEEVGRELELQRRVVGALAELREPYRSTIYLRYFRELGPGEIAARQSVPLETVRTRLRRGMAELREKLDAAHEGRAAWAVPLAAFGRGDAVVGTSVVGALGGMLVMKGVWFAAVAALVVGFWWWSGFGRSARELERREEVAEASVPANGTDSAFDHVERPAEATRTEVTQEREPIVKIESVPAAGVVRGRVLLPDGAPAGGVRIRFAGSAGRRSSPSKVHMFEDDTESDGCYALEIDADSSLEGSLYASRDGFATAAWHGVSTAPGEATDLGTYTLVAAGSLVVQVTDLEGAPLAAGYRVEVEYEFIELHPRHLDSLRHEKLDPATGLARFSDLPPGRPKVSLDHEAMPEKVTKAVTIEAGAETRLGFEAPSHDPGRRILMRVYGRMGRMGGRRIPVKNRQDHFHPIPSSIQLRGVDGIAGAPTKLEGVRGSFVFEDLDPSGSYTLEITDPCFAPTRIQEIAAGSEVELCCYGSAAIALEVYDARGGVEVDDYDLRMDAPDALFSPHTWTLRERGSERPEGGVYDGLLPTCPEAWSEEDSRSRCWSSTSSTIRMPRTVVLMIGAADLPEQRFEVQDLAPGETRHVRVDLRAGGRIEGVVLRPDGVTPAAGVEVELTRGELAGHSRTDGGNAWFRGRELPAITETTESDETGRFLFEPVDPDTWTVRAIFSSWSFADRTVRIERGAVEACELVEPEGGWIEIRMLGASSTELEDCLVTTMMEDRTRAWPSELGHMDMIRFDADGFCRVGPLMPTAMAVLLSRGRESNFGWGTFEVVPSRGVTVTGGETAEVVFDLRDEAKGGLVVGIDLSTLALEDLILLLECDGRVAGDPFQHVAAIPGRLDQRRVSLAPGGYRVSLRSRRERWRVTSTRVAQVRARAETEVELRPPLTAVRLRLVDATTDEPLAKCAMSIESRSLDPEYEIEIQGTRSTDEDGGLFLRSLDGSVTLRVDGYEPAEVSWPPRGEPARVEVVPR